MYNFTDLIARSYLQYTVEKDDDISFFFIESYQDIPKCNENPKIPEKQFYRKLILKIDNLLESCYEKKRVKPLGYQNFEHEYNDIVDADVNQLAYEIMEHNYILESYDDYIPLTPKNSGQCNDPITIIKKSDATLSADMVLRKSKLEYLKAEAIRARDTNSIDGLSEVIDLNKNLPNKPVDLSVYNLDYIEAIVKDRFKFTLEVYPRKKVPMLSMDEYLNLVQWVTYFFINNYQLPNNITPILGNNIGKTRIRTAFKNLFQFCHPRQPLPKSCYRLVPLCFYALKDDNEQIMQRTSDPDKDL